jgi:hypothetical protein
LESTLGPDALAGLRADANANTDDFVGNAEKLYRNFMAAVVSRTPDSSRI